MTTAQTYRPFGIRSASTPAASLPASSPVPKRRPYQHEEDRGEVFEPVGGNVANKRDVLNLATPRSILRDGSAGEAVRKLQSRLTDAGFKTTVDGDFGAGTKKAVQSFQRARNLTADGIVGPDTWAALTGAPAPVAPPAAPRYSDIVRTGAGTMVRRDNEMISTTLAPQFDRMVAAAARDGVRLRIRDGYRSVAEQRVLWDRFGHNRTRVAEPGHSNHQTGTAIDFANTPGAWRWLKRNAASFGLKNYAPEAWHYSLNGR